MWLCTAQWAEVAAFAFAAIITRAHAASACAESQTAPGCFPTFPALSISTRGSSCTMTAEESDGRARTRCTRCGSLGHRANTRMCPHHSSRAHHAAAQTAACGASDQSERCPRDLRWTRMLPHPSGEPVRTLLYCVRGCQFARTVLIHSVCSRASFPKLSAFGLDLVTVS